MANFGIRPIKMGGVSEAGGAGGCHPVSVSWQTCFAVFSRQLHCKYKSKSGMRSEVMFKMASLTCEYCVFPSVTKDRRWAYRSTPAGRVACHQCQGRPECIDTASSHRWSLLIHAPSVGLDASSRSGRLLYALTMRSAILISQHI